MQFNVTYGSGVTSQSSAFQSMFQTAVNAALQFFQQTFTNNITVNVTFNWAGLGGGYAAQNSFYLGTYSYSQVESALLNSKTSPDDAAAYATLPGSDPTGSGHVYALTTAQARALGFSASAPYDDSVTLNSALSWTFDPNNRAVAGTYDAIGALEHEITEGVFGRVAGLGSTFGSGIYTPLDLFRYSAPGVRDFTTSAADYFSVDGHTLLTPFNINALYGGDAGDWSSSVVGDSFGYAYAGTQGSVTATDLRELDLLGWTEAPYTAPTSAPTPTPTPAPSGGGGGGKHGKGHAGSNEFLYGDEPVSSPAQLHTVQTPAGDFLAHNPHSSTIAGWMMQGGEMSPQTVGHPAFSDWSVVSAGGPASLHHS